MATPPVPSGFSEEYLNANKGPQVLAIVIVFPLLATIIVSLRLYTRLLVVNAASYEDSAIFFALLFSIATSICQGFQVYNGMGRHIQSLTLEQGIGSLKALFASIITYNFCLTLVKLSIALQYIRIATDKTVQKWCWAFICLLLASCAQTFIAHIFTCYPVAKFWDDRIPGKCINKSALWYANAGINISQDLCLIVLPIFILRKLLMPTKQKYYLMLILGLGGFASLASILRLHTLYVVDISHDITWDNPGTATWSSIEVNIGIICASLPTLRAFLAQWFPRAFSSSIGTNSRQHHNNASSSRRHHGAQVLPDEKMFGNSSRSFGDRSTPGIHDIVVKFEVDVEQGRASTPNSQGSEIEMTGRSWT